MKHKTLPLRALTSKGRSSEKGAFTGEAGSRAGKGKDNYQRGPNILKVSVATEIRPHHEKVQKSRKRKQGKRRHRDIYSSPLSSTSSSDRDSTKEWSGSKKGLADRIKITETNRFKYKLPFDIADYVNAHFETYVKNTAMRDQILLQNPLPENFDIVKKLDDFI